MEPEVRVNADQVRIERGVMDFRQWYAVRHNRLPKSLVVVRDDVSRIEQDRLRQPGKRATTVVCRNYGLAERCLMQALFDGPQSISQFQAGFRRCEDAFSASPKATLAFKVVASHPAIKAGSIALYLAALSSPSICESRSGRIS